MGRQHTTWISDETWDRLRNIEGDSISKKLANAVRAHDPDHQMWFNAKLRQLEAAKTALRDVSKEVFGANLQDEDDMASRLYQLNDIVREIEWLWEASA